MCGNDFQIVRRAIAITVQRQFFPARSGLRGPPPVGFLGRQRRVTGQRILYLLEGIQHCFAVIGGEDVVFRLTDGNPRPLPPAIKQVSTADNGPSAQYPVGALTRGAPLA